MDIIGCKAPLLLISPEISTSTVISDGCSSLSGVKAFRRDIAQIWAQGFRLSPRHRKFCKIRCYDGENGVGGQDEVQWCEREERILSGGPAECSPSYFPSFNQGSSREGWCSCPIRKAFSSMVFMLRSVQSYTLHMRQVASCEGDFQCLLTTVQREMHSSLVWLFQQVFARTPKLMISVMILLANFVIFSMDNIVTTAERPITSGPSTRLLSFLEDTPDNIGHGGFSVPEEAHVLADSAGSGSSDRPHVSIAGGTGDEQFGGHRQKNAMIPKKDSSASDVYISGHFATGLRMIDKDVFSIGHERTVPALPVVLKVSSMNEQQIDDDGLLMMSMLKQAAQDLEVRNGRAPHAVDLTSETLVAPVSVQLEADNYECFDRTDLLYQHALSVDRDNPLLLANYAEFLLLVRHDHERAHDMFQRAIRADPADPDIISRFAKFLWLARGDRSAAEEAYRAAIAAEPSNPFYAGSYAHFLWHSGEDQAPCPIWRAQRTQV